MDENKPDLNSILFIDLVLSISSTAMQHLGKIVNALTGKIETNLTQAHSVINMLIMLKEKTKGNLSKQEQDIINVTISNLQLNYFDEIKNESKQKSS